MQDFDTGRDLGCLLGNVMCETEWDISELSVY